MPRPILPMPEVARAFLRGYPPFLRSAEPSPKAPSALPCSPTPPDMGARGQRAGFEKPTSSPQAMANATASDRPGEGAAAETFRGAHIRRRRSQGRRVPLCARSVHASLRSRLHSDQRRDEHGESSSHPDSKPASSRVPNVPDISPWLTDSADLLSSLKHDPCPGLRGRRSYGYSSRAEVAELADAGDSKSPGLTPLGVRLPSSAFPNSPGRR